MRLLRSPRVSRFLVLLALFQMVAPSVAAVADAWRLDQRTSVAHLEAERTAACVVVHAHDCLLCSVSTAPTGVASSAPTHLDDLFRCAPVARQDVRAPQATRRAWASPRAPPASLS